MPKRLVWCDMEMTGLDPYADTILEMAFIVTDEELRPLDDGFCIAVAQPESVLEGMDEWNRTHHAASGLSDRVRKSKTGLAEAQQACLDYLARFTSPKASPLCGNSIFQDRMFLVRHAPALNAFLHYRNIDVSSIKELVLNWYPELEPFKKKGLHLALDDIKESIEELKFYRRTVFRTPSGAAGKDKEEGVAQ